MHTVGLIVVVGNGGLIMWKGVDVRFVLSPGQQELISSLRSTFDGDTSYVDSTDVKRLNHSPIKRGAPLLDSISEPLPANS